MINIEKIDILTFALLFSNVLPDVATVRAQSIQASPQNSLLLGAYADNEPCGAAVARINKDDDALAILYVAVNEKYRRQHIFKRLIDECIRYAKDSKLSRVKCRLTYNESSGEFVNDYLLKRGFEKYLSSSTFIVNTSAQTVREWKDFLDKRGNRLISKLQNAGYSLVTYEEAGLEGLKKLDSYTGEKFPAELGPLCYEFPIAADFSSITMKGDIPVAYCLVTTPDDGKTSVVQSLASSYDYLNKGVFIYCLANSISTSLLSKRCDKVIYTVYNNNEKMLKMTKSFLNFTDLVIKEQVSYSYEL